MGICGADPVAIKDGMELPERHLRRREGHARAARPRAEHPHGLLRPRRRPGQRGAQARQGRRRRASARSQGFAYDKSVANVVVIGNGIAGVTAVDHLRRRHPVTQIDLIAEEPHHLYNRMGIARLVYGKSAMQGLYLNPDSWYGEREIETWLNTRALRHRPRRPRRSSSARARSCPTTS